MKKFIFAIACAVWIYAVAQHNQTPSEYCKERGMTSAELGIMFFCKP